MLNLLDVRFQSVFLGLAILWGAILGEFDE
jgi:hypothetical protein